MAISIPQLDVYFIDFSSGKEPEKKSAFSSLAKLTRPLEDKLPPVLMTTLKVNLSVSAIAILNPITAAALLYGPAKEAAKSLKRLVEDNRFYVIRTPEELEQFENAGRNAWNMGEKALKQKQYYIRHPKKSAQNLLIESQNFYKYIEQEEKDELIDFIMAHCNAKSIQIDRESLGETSAGVKVPVEGLNLSAGVNGGKTKGSYFSYSNPNGSIKTKPREEYFWIDKSLMRSIAALGEGASLSQRYEVDYRFGLTVGEASSIGLDLNGHKRFVYTIRVEC